MLHLSHEETPNSINVGKIFSVTTDDANVLRGKRTGVSACLRGVSARLRGVSARLRGVSARLRSMCKQLLLHSHCISHRCQLELKGIADKECEC